MTVHPSPLAEGALRLTGAVEAILHQRGRRPAEELLDNLERAYREHIPQAERRLRRI